MNRKQFLKRSIGACISCCGAAIGLNNSLKNASAQVKSQKSNATSQGWIVDLERRMVRGSETPAWRKTEKSVEWITDILENMDSMLDLETGKKIMQANGRSCYTRAFGVGSNTKPSPETADRFIGFLRARGYEINDEGEITTIIYNWGRDHQNPQGLIIEDGFCMCPIVESAPDKLSPTYCQCSAGYVKESFERSLGKIAEVEVLESLKMGGNDCVFKVRLFNS
ncbi:DUF6144 family protein [candidate division KSB1 bacterium]